MKKVGKLAIPQAEMKFQFQELFVYDLLFLNVYKKIKFLKISRIIKLSLLFPKTERFSTEFLIKID